VKGQRPRRFRTVRGHKKIEQGRGPAPKSKSVQAYLFSSRPLFDRGWLRLCAGLSSQDLDRVVHGAAEIASPVDLAKSNLADLCSLVIEK
jgi:hypothetical protein